MNSVFRSARHTHLQVETGRGPCAWRLCTKKGASERDLVPLCYCSDDLEKVAELSKFSPTTLSRSWERVFGDSCLLLFVLFFVADPAGMKGTMGGHLPFMSLN